MHLTVDILLKVFVVVRAGVIKLLEYPPYRHTGYPQNCLQKMMKFPRHLVEMLLLIVLVTHIDRFEQSSSPLERNITWPKTEHKMAKNGWKLSKVAITGSTRSLLAKNGR